MPSNSQTSSDITIERRFHRSIRIDKDLGDPDALAGFICPKSFESVLLSVTEHIDQSGQSAFTWTGPFGGGKSSLSIVLSALLSGNRCTRKTAIELTGDAGQHVVERLKPGNKGYRTVAVVGRKESAATLLRDAMKREKHFYRESKNSELNLEKRLLESLERVSNQDQNKGVVVFFDELGKILEAAADGQGDIHFLQDLAELAARSGGRIILIGILHQSFSEYAGRLGTQARDEWAKIQGRFVDIPITMMADEQVELISRAILSTPPKNAKKDAAKLGTIISKSRKRNKTSLTNALANCWPLSPVTATILGPYSRKRFGQNQRSIFNFLNSKEPQGFQQFINERVGDEQYQPVHFWGYLRANIEPSILASNEAHRWATALDAIERCEARGGSEPHIVVAKTIAIVEQFREESGYYPTDEVLKLCLPAIDNSLYTKIIKDLSAWSIIRQRKHINGYGIFAGSDFDLDSALDSSKQQNLSIDVKSLNRLSAIKPVLAMRHYHETGALRWMSVTLTTAGEFSKTIEELVKSQDALGHYVLLLPDADTNADDCWKIVGQPTLCKDDGILISVAQNGTQLFDAAQELLATEHLQENRGELQGDAVARREVETRLLDLKGAFAVSVDRAFHNTTWHWGNEKVPLQGRQYLTKQASTIASELLNKAPMIKNELLNREKPSSSAMAARRALLNAMVTHRSLPRLGIEGLPAEAALYETILKQSGVHRVKRSAEAFHFDMPTPKRDPARLRPLWEAADQVVNQSSSANTVTVQDIYNVWKQKPYGVSEGLLIVLGLAYLLSPSKDLAIYLDGLYRPVIDDFVADRLHQEPSAVEIKKVELNKTRTSILKGLADSVSKYSNEPVPANDTLEIAKHIVSHVMQLPEWVLRTQLLSPNAIALRSIISSAHDPNRFLFDDLSELGNFEVEPKSSNTQEKSGLSSIDSIVGQVSSGLEELSNAYGLMLGELKLLLESELQFDSATELDSLHTRAELVSGISGDFRLDAFATRLLEYDCSDRAVEGIASLAANKPPDKWVDKDLDSAKLEIADLARRFKRAEALAHVQNRDSTRNAVAIVLSDDSTNQIVSGDFTYLDTKKDTIKKAENLLTKQLDKLDLSDEETLAVLSRLCVSRINKNKSETT